MRKHGDCFEQIQSVDGKREEEADALALLGGVASRLLFTPRSAQLLTQVGENGTRLPLSPKIPHGSLALGCSSLLRLCISKKLAG